ncbi:hypothetical protein AURDEDRAFT_187655 [Auricularia subglabra TFB-10046 SS5]|nr:hypothetical protein AURDEDRAFT_187655 [Auricularia subglabra TFB-10046 SS5]
MLFFPTELRRAIAVYCDTQTLGRLSYVDRLWNAECLPVLYESVRLRIGAHSEDANAACYHRLAQSPELAAHVRAVLVEYSAGGLIEKAHALSEALLCLPNLVDLRLRHIMEGHSVHEFVRALFGALGDAAARCLFRLRALHISDGALWTVESYPNGSAQQRAKQFKSPLDEFLHPHAATLRVLGIFSLESQYDLRGRAPVSVDLIAHHYVRDHCVIFGGTALSAQSRRSAPSTHNGGHSVHEFVRALFGALGDAAARCLFRLRALHISDGALWTVESYPNGSAQQRAKQFKSPLDEFLHPHAATLRVLGIFSLESQYDLRGRAPVSVDLIAHHYVRDHCVIFGYCFLSPAAGLAVALDTSAPADAAAVARSLADDPCARVSGATIEYLNLWDGDLPLDAALTACFPGTRTLRLPVSCAPLFVLEPDAIARAASPLSNLVTLELKARWLSERNREVLPIATLETVARAVFAAGCGPLAIIDFPDGSKLRFLGPPQDATNWCEYQSPPWLSGSV